ncbi:uncharacterized protein CG43427 [Chrysoperla carnea]|uniref:uncharacterized protein CG43427 n=1 Tax=Chrysoperla carnea TaxID=189513 RepID=UPI001D088311|nr:uncharacterized protein CG43427 [Chrysoperla carnea]
MERRSSTLDLNSKNNNTTGINGNKEGTEYIPARCRITKPNPPKPAQNPLQFVKVGPCDLYRSAQEQLKKVEVIKKIKQEFKEDGEDWQANLDNWKSSRRKRQEHIIERVVEIRNMEQESDKSRRRSKTFSEMLEDRNSRRRKLSNLALYSEDDGNDLADLGISTPSRKGSISEESNTTDDTHNIRTDSAASDDNMLMSPSSEQNQNESTANSNTIDDCKTNGLMANENSNEKAQEQTEEYTYESAIQGYKSRVKRRSFHHTSDYQTEHLSQSTSNINSTKNEDRRFSLYTLQSLNSQSSNDVHHSSTKPDLPKIDISERKQLFETKSKITSTNQQPSTNLPDELSHSKSIKERLKHLEKCTEESLNIKKATKLLAGDIMTVRDRLSSLVSHTNVEKNNNILSVWSSTSQLIDNNGKALRKAEMEQQTRSLCHMDKGRMFHCSLDSLDIRGSDSNQESGCTLEHVQSLDGLDYCERSNYPPSGSSTELLALSQCGDTDREDSGIQTADVSCSVSQADDPDDDSDTMAAINTVCVDTHLNENPLKKYLSSIELPPMHHQHQTPPTSPEITDVASTTTTKSESSVVEELITCTINNLDLRNKIVFDEPIADPLAPPKSVEPPKEKPPPPPIDDEPSDDEYSNSTDYELKRLNSTKRIKNEIRNKRSSFLGIEGLTDINDLELTVSKPPDAATILQEELQLEKQMYRQSQNFNNNDFINTHAEIESRDSGVELESNRSISEHQFQSSSEVDPTENTKTTHITHNHNHEEDEISKKEREIIENLEKEEQWRHNSFNNKDSTSTSRSSLYNNNNNTNNHFSIQSSNSGDEKDDSRYGDDEDVIRVERELLELEQEELERQREDLLYQNRKANILNSVSKHSIGLPDVYLRNTSRPIEHVYNNYPNYYQQTSPTANQASTNLPLSPPPRPPPATTAYSKILLPNTVKPTSTSTSTIQDVSQTGPMSRHTLHALSATPKSKLMNTDSWIQSQPIKKSPMTLTSTLDRDNYNQHWLIQEAEERRLSERSSRLSTANQYRNAEKHIPDAVVQTLTQRIQNRPTVRERTHLLNRKDLPISRGPPITPPISYERSRPPPPVSTMPPPIIPPQATDYDLHDKMLSVSGKKKCSHCGDELGRGAAMIIESLCLFYHMDCFKCCVCHVQLGDGLMGTDVRVRNHKLHCHNCYSSDDGVKFSCV